MNNIIKDLELKEFISWVFFFALGCLCGLAMGFIQMRSEQGRIDREHQEIFEKIEAVSEGQEMIQELGEALSINVDELKRIVE